MSIARSIFHGSIWMILLNAAARMIGLVSTMILARLLVPEDFGIVAMAMSVIGLLELMAEFGFESALIQRQDATRAHYDTVWTIRLGFGVLLSLLVAGLAIPASAFFEEPKLITVMLTLAPLSFLTAVENIGVVNFRKEMQFDREFRFILFRRLVTFFVTVTLALIFRTYWALVLGILVGRIVSVILSYLMHPFRPRFSLAERQGLYSFSGWIFVNSLISAFAARLSHFLIGRLHGASALGLYTVAFEVADLPGTELSAPINRAAFPGYSRMRLQKGALETGFIDVLAMVAIIVIPAGVGIAIVADALVLTLFGAKWTGAIPIVQLLAISAMLGACTSGNYYVYLAQARTHIPPIIGVAHVGIFVLLLSTLFIDAGVVGVAKAELGAAVCSGLVSVSMLTSVTEIRLIEYFRAVWRPATASLVMYLALREIGITRISDMVPLFQLISIAATGAILYVASVYILWTMSGKPEGAERKIIEQVAAWRSRVF